MRREYQLQTSAMEESTLYAKKNGKCASNNFSGFKEPAIRN
jgi:hypothetical protein